jgi:hypothetical protein
LRGTSLERLCTHDAAVLAKEKTPSLAQPPDCIPRGVKWPQPRDQHAQENAGTDRS